MIVPSDIARYNLLTLEEYFMLILEFYVHGDVLTAKILAQKCSPEQKMQAKIFYISCSSARRNILRSKVQQAHREFSK